MLLVFNLSALGTAIAAAENRFAPRNFDKREAATYLVREPPDQSEPFLRLITLTADRNWIIIDAYERSFSFTNQQGVWI